MFYESIKAMNVALRLCYINVYGKKEDGRNRREKINLSSYLSVYLMLLCLFLKYEMLHNLIDEHMTVNAGT